MLPFLKAVKSRLMLAAAAVISLAGCASAPTRPTAVNRDDHDAVRQYVTELIRHRMKANNVAGLSIALVDGQKIVWAEGFGFADKEKNIPANADTTYRVGSISKLFTATAAMQLAEQGRFDIDRPLQAYLPAFSVRSRFTGTPPITPRHLMTHHSGLPGDIERGMWNPDPEPFTRVVEKVRDEYAASPPGFVWAYSNVGVTLLGHAIQNVYGEDFASGVERNVLRPLGMVNSRFTVRAEGPLMARGYHKGEANDDPPLRDMPAGGLNSNVVDLGRFLQMVFADGKAGTQQVLKPETLAEMLRPQNGAVALDRNFKMGLGWILGGLGDIHIENAGPVAHHGGATLMHNSQLIALPEHKLGVVVLANSSNSRPVVDEIATETIKLALEAKSGIRQPGKRDEGRQEQPLTDDELTSFPGHYATLVGDARIVRSGDRLSAELSGKRFDLVSRGEGQLGLQYKLFGMLSIPLGPLSEVSLSRKRIAGRDAVYATTGSQSMLVGERVEPAPIPAKWRARIGSYEVVNGKGDYTQPQSVSLRERDGFLVMEALVPQFIPVPLTLLANALDDSELLILGLGRGKGETIRAMILDGQEYLVYSGYMARRKGD